jgi:hypothetical protein
MMAMVRIGPAVRGTGVAALRLGDGVPDIRSHGGNWVSQGERSHHGLQCTEAREGDDGGALRSGNPLHRRGREPHPRIVRRASRRHRAGKTDGEHGQVRVRLLSIESANHGTRYGDSFHRRGGRDLHPRFVRRTSCRRRTGKLDGERGQLRIWLLRIEETTARGGHHEPLGGNGRK